MKDSFIESLKNSELGLYDSDTNKTIYAKKVVDLTHLCSDSEQFIVKYGKAKRGLLAQMVNLYKKGEDLGSVCHFFLNEHSAKTLSKDEVFKSMCIYMSANPYEVAVYIYINAPL